MREKVESVSVVALNEDVEIAENGFLTFVIVTDTVLNKRVALVITSILFTTLVLRTVVPTEAVVLVDSVHVDGNVRLRFGLLVLVGLSKAISHV